MSTSQKISAALGDVQETLMIPLYGRAVEARKRRPLLRDPKAVEIVSAIDYDFAKFDGKRSLFGTVLRTAIFDEWVRDFLTSHPKGTVVEIGAGLNTRFERLDNGRCRWFDLDLPDSIALRRRFFTDSERRVQLAASVAEPAWMERVRSTGGPYFLVAEAVFMYLEPSAVRAALASIARTFPGALIAFDTVGRWLVENQHKHDVMKDMAARFRWACSDPHEIERWETGVILRKSCNFFSAPAPLQKHVPLPLRVIGPLLLRKQVGEYRMNLFEAAGAG